MNNSIICPRCKDSSVVDQRMTKTGRQPLWKCENYEECRNLGTTNWPWSSWDVEPDELMKDNPSLFVDNSSLNKEMLSDISDDIEFVRQSNKSFQTDVLQRIDELIKRMDKIEKNNEQRIINFHETNIFENDEERYIRESLENEEKERTENFKITGIKETNHEKNVRETLYSTKDSCPNCSGVDGKHAPSCYA